jgi:hypothetical protein
MKTISPNYCTYCSAEGGDMFCIYQFHSAEGGDPYCIYRVHGTAIGDEYVRTRYKVLQKEIYTVSTNYMVLKEVRIVGLLSTWYLKGQFHEIWGFFNGYT